MQGYGRLPLGERGNFQIRRTLILSAMAARFVTIDRESFQTMIRSAASGRGIARPAAKKP